MRHTPRLEEQRDPPVEGAPAELEGRQRQCVPELQRRIGDHGERHVLAGRELDLLLERLRGEPGDAYTEPLSSNAWSRKPHDCGVHPRAPGIASQAAGVGRPGTPVAGYT